MDEGYREHFVIEDAPWSGKIILIIFFVAIVLMIYPYIQSFFLTRQYLTKEDGFLEICEERGELKYVQIISYEPQYDKAIVDCVFENSDDNLRLRLFKNDNDWKVDYSKKLNTKGNLYWPVFN